jgi:hypothetical protein
MLKRLSIALLLLLGVAGAAPATITAFVQGVRA